MKRQHQVFAAPGNDADPLPVAPSPWHRGRFVELPREHWHLLLQFAETIDPEKASLLMSCAGSRDYLKDGDIIFASQEDVAASLDFLEELSSRVTQAAPLAPQPTPDIPEEYPNSEHARMLEAIAAVFRETLRTGQPFRAWAE